MFSRAQGVVGGALNLASSGWSWTKFGISTGFWAAGRGIRLPGRLLSQLRGGEGLNRFAVSMTAPREVSAQKIIVLYHLIYKYKRRRVL